MSERDTGRRAAGPTARVPPPAAHPRTRAVLVMRALGLGDFLTGVPALRALERVFPEDRLVLAGPPAYAELADLAGLNYELLRADGPEPPPWNGGRPDLAVNLHGRGPQSIDALLALRPHRVWSHGHPHFPEVCGPPWPEGAHDVHIWSRLLAAYDCPSDPRELHLPPPAEEAPVRRAVVIHPGASKAARRWPELRYAEVARHLAARGHRVVVTGTRDERRLAARVARVAGLSPRSVLAGRTSLSRLAALVADAELVVCGDTGVAHLATAYRTPSVRLFGASSPSRWGPLVDRHLHTCLWAGVGGGREDRPSPGLVRIGTSEVSAACEALLDPEAAPAPTPLMAEPAAAPEQRRTESPVVIPAAH